MSLAIHLVSDIHLEFYKETEREKIPLPEIFADVLVLCGDISTTSKLSLSNLNWYIEQVRSQFKYIIYVLGNHEFYGTSLTEGLKVFEKFCKEREITLLDINSNYTVMIKGKLFFGSTLWSDLKNNDFFVKNLARAFMNDFRAIKGFNIDTQLEQNSRTLAAIERLSGEVDVFITHYKPIVTSHSFYGFNDHAYLFGNTKIQEQVFSKTKAELWLYGHTHDNLDHEFDSIFISSNQVGYKNGNVFERMLTSYDNSKVYIVS